MKRYVASLAYVNYLSNNRTMGTKLKNYCLQESAATDNLDFFAKFPSKPSQIFQGPCTLDHIPDKGFKAQVEKLLTDSSFQFEFVPSADMPCQASVTSLHIPIECELIFGSKVCQFNYTKVETNQKDFYAITSYYNNFFKYMGSQNDTISYDLAYAKINHICQTASSKEQHWQTLCFQLTYILNHLMVGYDG